jgi:hypothetical protein
MTGICAELRATVLCPSRRRRGAAYSLLCSSVNGSWVALQVHTIVRDAPDFDNPSWSYPVQEKVTSATAMSRNVQNAEAPHDLVSGLGSSDIGTVGELADRLNKRVAIATGLPRWRIASCCARAGAGRATADPHRGFGRSERSAMQPDRARSGPAPSCAARSRA